MSNFGDQISLFCNVVKQRRFDEATLQVLQSILVSRDVESLLEIRSSLKEFLRSESVAAIREIAEKPIQHKLLILDFFVHAFAIVNDVENCLALRYEALVLRQSKSASYHWLQVSHSEWVTFAEHAFDNGFYSVAVKACGYALACLHMSSAPTGEDFVENEDATANIKRLEHIAMAFSATHSVQVQTAEYLKKKAVKSLKHSSFNEETVCSSSTSFRNGIKKRNERNLRQHQCRQKVDGN